MSLIPGHIIQLLQQKFDRIFVITVPRFTDRQEKIKARLRGLAFEFFYGMDKNDLTEELIRKHYQHDKKNTVTVNLYAKPLNRGEIACSISHRLLYEMMLKNNWEKILVFEDDVVPDVDKISLLPAALNELPNDWEFLYLGYLKNSDPGPGRYLKQYWYTIQSRLGLTKLPYTMVKNLVPSSFSAHLMKAGYHDCAHAYGITRKAAEKLLTLQTPVRFRADNAINHLVLKNEIKAYACKPSLFHQEIFLDRESGKSYIR